MLRLVLASLITLSTQRTAVALKEVSASILDDLKTPYLVEFYSKFCGSCTEFMPTVEKTEKLLKKAVPVGKINIEDKPGRELAEKEGALEDGLPSLRLYYKDGDTVSFERILEPDTVDFPPAETLAKKVKATLKKIGKSGEL
ncbi:unnamed protein product [Amoebophrya sp. A120]|nr:unnamed protein product [Amoebophrya sp. A120]|eukprot:GSA120T00004045001.1